MPCRSIPATLDVAVPNRPPVRIGVEDHREIYDLASLPSTSRSRVGHGRASGISPRGPGRAGATGRVWFPFRMTVASTYRLLGSMAGHHGPLTVEWLIYEEFHQLRDLLGLLRALGDQVRSVTISREPSGVQLQAPSPSRCASYPRPTSEPQPARCTPPGPRCRRLLDLPAVLRLALPGINLTFGLRLHDPLVERSGAPPRPGIGGDYTVHLGEESGVIDGCPPVRHLCSMLRSAPSPGCVGCPARHGPHDHRPARRAARDTHCARRGLVYRRPSPIGRSRVRGPHATQHDERERDLRRMFTETVMK